MVIEVVFPIKPWNKARVTVKFLDESYPSWRKAFGYSPAEHTGIDINIGPAGDWDLGYPVRSIYYGKVVHAKPHRVWGNIVLIHHPGLNVWTQYAHLHRVSVNVGDEVCEGEDIGSIGKGDPTSPFIAHLHFEVRTKDIPADAWPGMDIDFIKNAYMDPLYLFRKFSAKDTPERCR